MAVRELFRWAGGLDVFGVKVDHVARREGRCGRVAAVVIPCYIVLCLGQRQFGFLEGVLHPMLMRKCFLLGFTRCNVSRAIPVVRWGTTAIVLSCTIIP